MLQVANGFVDSTILLFHQSRVKPGRWVIRIKLFCEPELVGGTAEIPGVTVSLAEVTAEDGALRFQRRRDQQILAPSREVAEVNPRQSAPRPGISERGIHG